MINWKKCNFIGVRILVVTAVGTLIFNRMTSSASSQAVLQACRIHLRYDQRMSDIGRFNNREISLYAPKWVSEGLRILGERLEGTEFEVWDGTSTTGSSKFKLSLPLTLFELQKAARNEQSNTSGRIELANYYPALHNKDDEIIALKDLVRQTVIVGKDTTTHYGGFPRGNERREQSNVPVYVVDLAALQFQQNYNSGRLVLITADGGSGKRPLDDFIFENVVGEKKKTYEEVVDEGDNRFIAVRSRLWRRKVFFDTFAYRQFVSNDVLLSGMALVDTVDTHSRGDRINFKFLKYGSGFFASDFRDIVNEHILSGVVDGLEKLFHQHNGVSSVIKHLEFPFYDRDQASVVQRLELLKKEYGVEYSFSKDDALKATKVGLITATTNCADSMAVIGNEMRYGSVDAAIAENLKSKGNPFCPVLNAEMEVKLIDIRLTSKNTDAQSSKM